MVNKYLFEDFAPEASVSWITITVIGHRRQLLKVPTGYNLDETDKKITYIHGASRTLN